MKAQIKNLLLLFMITFCSIIYFSSCTEEVDDEEPIPDTGNINQGDSLQLINKINSALKLTDAKVKSGTIPPSANLADLKFDKDTIHFWPGIKTRIRILKEQNVFIGGISLQVKGADEYYEIPIEENESNDTIVVFYMDLDPENLELPFDFGLLKIVPTNDKGEGIDEGEKPIEADPPFDDDTYDPGKHNKTPNPPLLNKNLYWIYTTVDGEFQNAPGYTTTSSYTTMGCCNDGYSEPCISFQSPNASIQVDNQYSLTDFEVIKFHDDQTWIYQLKRSFNDYYPQNSDFCTGKAGYKYRSGQIIDGGAYKLTPANGFETFYKVTILTSDLTLEDALNAGFGSITNVNDGFPDYEYYLGSNYYVELINVEGGVMQRVFEAQSEGWVD